jgi:hypothetical protein
VVPYETPVSLLHQMATLIGLIDAKGNAAAVFRRIIDRVRRAPRLFVFDETQHLNVRGLEALRHLHDQTGVGVVISGSNQLRSRLRESDNAGTELAQLWSRVGQVYELKLLNDEDARAMIAANLHHAITTSAVKDLILAAGRRARTLVKLCDILERGGKGRSAALTSADVFAARDLLLTGKGE